jgi:glycosyltransferase involved in cell wall biosynthesis
VHCGIAGPPGETPQQRARFFERFPDLAGKRIVLFFGRIHEKKGCDQLIRSFAAASGSMAPSPWPGASSSPRPWHLVLAGPPVTAAYRAQLERLIAEARLTGRVTWTGMLTGDDKWAAFRAADAFVLPSHQENFGVAVVEALACGVPVLVSNKVNIWREILTGQAGLVEPDDQNGTDRLLTGWMSLDPAVQRRMQRNARRCFEERFDVRQAAARLASVVEGLR